ncbi:MAG: cation:proton antiporter [Chloroflexi bacterium]|nr:cation:proton antiporter [Chloroflexota bacterium]
MTLVIALGAAGIGALGAAFLRQSLVLGYIVAGLVIGPHTPGFVADVPTVEELADLGVVFLMFAIGVQLSFSDLRRVGGVALLGGGAQVLLTIAIVYGIGRAVGFGWLEALFLGSVISNSSSTVLSKVLSERGDLDSVHGRISLAWSTVQDFSTVALAVVLTTLAKGTTDTLAVDLVKALGLAAVFLVLVIPPGLLLLPRFFERVSAVGNVELFTFAAAGVALGVAYLAESFGISVALGAFVGGILVGRSDVSHEVDSRMAPLRDLFAGLFFVSVGMLIDVRVVFDNLWLVGLTVALIVGVKGAMSGLITLAFGYRGPDGGADGSDPGPVGRVLVPAGAARGGARCNFAGSVRLDAGGSGNIDRPGAGGVRRGTTDREDGGAPPAAATAGRPAGRGGAGPAFRPRDPVRLRAGRAGSP